ncbi:hypothetical protein PA598K_01953 [Paenibacillus sp. 598K]|uniref:ABC transporter substrate-binding protein n=1 Tax=Paenibacillus sp. 598K TaxID=1117987 RepID=UPI000FFAFCC2|nr:ABC transporter substrate-binding protein [Paenibacillus sp. 598K]GBF73645.1 hypothetical protein PA598K_01953 [Paenibacillus sp. 598K]
MVNMSEASPTRGFTWKLLGAVLLLMLLAACGGNSGEGGSADGKGGAEGTKEAAAAESPSAPEEGEASGELPELRLNVVSTGTQSLPAYLIEKLALDQKHGFKLVSVPDSGAVNGNWTAFKTGQVDAIISDWISLARSVNQGDEAVAVVPFLGWGNGLVVPEATEVSGLEQLKGLSIGVYNRLAPDWLFIRAAAKELYGFDPEKENTVSESAPGLLLGLMQEGKVEAALNYGDLNNILLGMGGYKKPFLIEDVMTQLGLSTDAPFLFYTFSESYVDAHPDTVKAFAAAYKEAIETLNSDDAIWQDIAERMKIDNETTIELMKDNARTNIFTEMNAEMEGHIEAIFEVLLQEAGEKQLGIGSLPEGIFRQP